METPIWNFIRAYRKSGTARFHMPGHKGRPILGCEELDLTEIQGADSLYEAEGIIAQSEQNTTRLFGSGQTLFSTEGSSQCIRAMLYLALTHRRPGTAPVIVAARNVHKAFVYAAALLDAQVVWLWPEEPSQSLCACPITAQGLENTLKELKEPPAAVYLTSPDYLGNMGELSELARVAHGHGTILLVDNAHGAYLKFLEPSRHPLDLGADLCCDSAHKTLPVLTGGAYLHLSRRISEEMGGDAKAAMALFGSTSPSYLTLASLDCCNAYLAADYGEKLKKTGEMLETIREQLRENGWQVEQTDPLRLTITARGRETGLELAQRLRQQGMECEYADPDSLVLMLTPENAPEDLHRLVAALGKTTETTPRCAGLPLARGEQVMSIRQALFAPHAPIPACQALGRICGAPTVSCPPAIPIAVSGERITRQALELFAYYGVETVDVLK